MSRLNATLAAAAALMISAGVQAHAQPAAAGTTQAQAQAAAAQKAPDWSGIYLFARGDALAGFKPLNEDLDPVVMAHLQPWARAKMDATVTEADDTGAICQLAGIFRHPPTVAGFQWINAPGKVLIVSSIIQEVGVRQVRLTDRHPRDLPYTWLGHSIGRWEGQTFVIDTVGFNDKSWLMSGMEPHTEDLHVVERIRQAAEGLLEVTTTVDDRKALTGPYSYSRYYRKTDADYKESICNGEPGEPQRWNGFRKDAIQRQMTSRAQADAGAPAIPAVAR